MNGMLHSICLAFMPLLLLSLLSELDAAPAPLPTPLKVVYGDGDSCNCPKQLGYQLNLPRQSRPYDYEVEYGYRVDKPVQTNAKTKIRYSFDLTVEQPRTPRPARVRPSKLHAKVDRVLINKPDCRALDKSKCGCSSCSASRPRYVAQQSSSVHNSIRRRRDLSSPGSLLRKRFMRHQQLQERPARYVKFYHKDLQDQQQKLHLFGLMSLPEALNINSKRKTKKVPTNAINSKQSKSWPGLVRRLKKRDIKGEYDLLEQERANADLTLPEIIQFMPETLNPSFQRGQCHMGCGALPAGATPETTEEVKSSFCGEQLQHTELPAQTESAMDLPLTTTLVNSVPAKRAALSYYPQQIAAPQPRPYNSFKFVDDSQLRDLLSTTSVPDPLEQSSMPLRFAGDLESMKRRSYAAPVLGTGSGYPVEHISDGQLDSIISGLVYNHPEYVEDYSHYEGSLVEAGPAQKKQTQDFLKKLIDGRLGGWGFDSATGASRQADYPPTSAETYGYKNHQPSSYSVDTYNVPPFGEYLRSWL